MNKEQMDLVDEFLAEIKAAIKNSSLGSSEGEADNLYHIIACTVWQIAGIVQD